MDQEKLNTFIHLLQKVRKQPANTFDLGLIIKEPRSKISADIILEAIKKIINIEKITYDQFASDEGVMDEIVSAFEKNEWVFLEIKKDIGSPLLNQLKHLANRNSFQLFDYKNKDVFEMEIPGNSRVVVFAERDFVENKISYPHFYRLFSPVLSLE